MGCRRAPQDVIQFAGTQASALGTFTGFLPDTVGETSELQDSPG